MPVRWRRTRLGGDRYRLAVRDLVPETGGDGPFRALAPAAALRRWRRRTAPWRYAPRASS